MASPEVPVPDQSLRSNTTALVPDPAGPFIPDLNHLAANELRQIPDVTVRELEAEGQLYSTIFRQLQIRPGEKTLT